MDVKSGVEYKSYFNLQAKDAFSRHLDNLIIVTHPVMYQGEIMAHLVLGYSLVSFYQNIRTNILICIGVFFILLIISLGISLLFIQSIINALDFISTSIYEISQGKGDLTKSIKVKSKDEIARLALRFNLFLSSIRNIIIRLKNISSKTKEIGQNHLHQ